jgi:hypothetical protein
VEGGGFLQNGNVQTGGRINYRRRRKQKTIGGGGSKIRPRPKQ